MQTQNYQNHTRMVTGFHYITFLGIFTLIGGSLNYLFKSSPENKYLASLLVLTSFLFVLVAWYLRVFALKAQDRAIRAEEQLRYYVMTGKLFPAELTIQQIIALRFASDTEFLALVDRAVAEKMSNKAIKQAIQNWRGDYYRV